MDNQDLIGQKLLLAFDCKQEPTPDIVDALRRYRPAGLTLFRHLNIENPGQLRALNDSFQRFAGDLGLAPLIIAADQEGGQLMAIGEGATPLPGNMALGAADSVELSRKAGEVLGSELAAMGVNVNYAPVCDVNVNPQNPVIGIRSFGEKPEAVAKHAAAMIAGIQTHGVAATAKHFPGHGDTSVDSHHGMQTVPHEVERLRAVELPPFAAAIEAGCKLIMTAHVGLPAIDGDDAPPATLSPSILQGILREELGYQGLITTDAMDMMAIRQGEALGEDALRAVSAGVDFLLLTSDPSDHRRVHGRLTQALRNGSLDRGALASSAERVRSLKRWLVEAATRPGWDVIGCKEHMEVATEIAERSITLVRNQSGLLPLNLGAEQRIAVVLPEPLDLTPADTSSSVPLTLAQAVREYHAQVDEFTVPHSPEEADGAALRQKLGEYDLILLGTINACSNPRMASLVRNILKLDIPTVVVALRLPYDLAAFPEAPVYVCTYSILESSMYALAKTLFGRIPFRGRLPVSIPDLFPL